MKKMLVLVTFLFSFLGTFANDFLVYFNGFELKSYQYPKKISEGNYFPYYETNGLTVKEGTINFNEENATIIYKYTTGDEFIASNIVRTVKYEQDAELGTVERLTYTGKWDSNGIEFKFQFTKKSDGNWLVKLFSKRNFDSEMGGEYYNKEFTFLTTGDIPLTF